MPVARRGAESQSSRRGAESVVEASARRGANASAGASAVPPRSPQEKGPQLTHAVEGRTTRMHSHHLRVRGTRPYTSGRCQVRLVSELPQGQPADSFVASRRTHPVRLNYGRVRSARYVRASAICAREGPAVVLPIVSSAVKKIEFFSPCAPSGGNSLAK